MLHTFYYNLFRVTCPFFCYSFDSFTLDISIAPLSPLILRDAPDYSIDNVAEFRNVFLSLMHCGKSGGKCFILVCFTYHFDAYLLKRMTYCFLFYHEIISNW